MQEARIFKLLSGSPSDEFEIVKRSAYEQITERARVIKTLGVGSEESIEPQKEYNALVDNLIDNPFQVFVPACDTNLIWADLEGGSVTGTRDTLNLRSPWKEPNFGIKFHYRHREEDVGPPRSPVLPGGRSLYGGQWHSFERTLSFSQFYDPRPYDSSPYDPTSPSSHTAPNDPPSPARSDVSSSSNGVELKNKQPSKNPRPQTSAIPEPQKHKRHRSVTFASLSSSVHTDMNRDLHDIAEEPESLNERIPTTITVTGHTIAPFQYQSRHLNCFPYIARSPLKKVQLNLERACAQYKAYDDYLRAPHEEDVAANFFRVASELNIPPVKDDKTETPAWQIKREESELRKLRRAAEDHRMAASPRAEEQGYNARRMDEEEKRLIEEQEKKIQAQNAQEKLDAEEEDKRKMAEDQELINEALLAQECFAQERNRKLQAQIVQDELDAKEEEMRQIAEQQKLAHEALLAKQHRKAAFKFDSSKSFLGANAVALAKGAPVINTATRNIEMSEVVAREMGVPEANIAVQVLSQAVDKLKDDSVPNVDMAALVLGIAQKNGVREEDVASTVLAMAQAGIPNMDGALQAIVLAQNQNRAAARTNVFVPKARPRVHFREREKKRRGLVFKNAAVLERERLAIDKAKAEAEQECWEDEAVDLDGGGDDEETNDFLSAAKNEDVPRTTKFEVAETEQEASDTMQAYTEVATAIDEIKIAVQGAANSVAVSCCRSPRLMSVPAGGSCQIPLATAGDATNSCAIDSDSDADDEWNPEWMVDQRYKKQTQYSPGGTRLD